MSREAHPIGGEGGIDESRQRRANGPTEDAPSGADARYWDPGPTTCADYGCCCDAIYHHFIFFLTVLLHPQ